MGRVTEARLYLADDSDNRAPGTGELQVSASRVLDRKAAAAKEELTTTKHALCARYAVQFGS